MPSAKSNRVCATSSIFLVCLVLCSVFPPRAGAVLIDSPGLPDPISLDNPTEYAGGVDHRAPIRVQRIEFEGDNWEGSFREGDFDADGVNDDIRVRLQHLVAPHVREVAPGVSMVVLLLDVVPGGPLRSAAVAVRHPGVRGFITGHFDVLQVDYIPQFGGGLSLIAAAGDHLDTLPPDIQVVPAPSALLLFGTGLAGLFALRRIGRC